MIPDIDKREFIYRYRDDFNMLGKVKSWFPNSKGSMSHGRVRFIARMARIELGYAATTANTDIVYHLYKKMNNIEELLSINDLMTPQSGSEITFTKKIRIYTKNSHFVLNKQYLDSLGIHLEANGDVAFGISLKAKPPLFVFNLSEAVLKKGKNILAKAVKPGYSPSKSDKGLVTQLLTVVGIDLEPDIKKCYDFTLQHIADNDVGKWFRLVRENG